MDALALNDLFSVQGKVVLVTGGSRGIGKMVSTCYRVFFLVYPAIGDSLVTCR